MGKPDMVQSRDLESLPVGTWELSSLTSLMVNGDVTDYWPNAVGRITYDADGHVTGLLMSGRRNEANGISSPPDAQGEFTAYFGTYRVDAAQGLITHQVDASLSATQAAGELRR